MVAMVWTLKKKLSANDPGRAPEMDPSPRRKRTPKTTLMPRKRTVAPPKNIHHEETSTRW